MLNPTITARCTALARRAPQVELIVVPKGVEHKPIWETECTVMLVEPFANDRIEDNLNPVGRLYYAGSTTICCAHSLSEEVGLALGAQAGEGRLAQVFKEAGFTTFRRATETPFNLILEARL